MGLQEGSVLEWELAPSLEVDRAQVAHAWLEAAAPASSPSPPALPPGDVIEELTPGLSAEEPLGSNPHPAPSKDLEIQSMCHYLYKRFCAPVVLWTLNIPHFPVFV